MMYKGTLLTDTISIHEVFTIHYFEYMSDFSFAGESHNFWEFVFVDKGEIDIYMESFVFVDKGEIDIYMESIHARLKKGEVAFHKPNEFHRLQATGSSAPNLVVISFECSDAVMQFFEGKIFSLDETEKILLGEIVKEAKTLFNCRLDDPYLTENRNDKMRAASVWCRTIYPDSSGAFFAPSASSQTGQSFFDSKSDRLQRQFRSV